MSLQVNINDDKINNFSNDAILEFEKQLEKYGDNIIKEANLIEEADRVDGASTEITSNIVLQAVRKNKISNTKKINKTLIVVKIISVFSFLILLN